MIKSNSWLHFICNCQYHVQFILYYIKYLTFFDSLLSNEVWTVCQCKLRHTLKMYSLIIRNAKKKINKSGICGNIKSSFLSWPRTPLEVTRFSGFHCRHLRACKQVALPFCASSHLWAKGAQFLKLFFQYKSTHSDKRLLGQAKSGIILDWGKCLEEIKLTRIHIAPPLVQQIHRSHILLLPI